MAREDHMGGVGLHKEPATALEVGMQGAALQGQILDLQLGLRAEIARGPCESCLELYTSVQVDGHWDCRRQQRDLRQQLTRGKGIRGQLQIELWDRSYFRRRTCQDRVQVEQVQLCFGQCDRGLDRSSVRSWVLVNGGKAIAASSPLGPRSGASVSDRALMIRMLPRSLPRTWTSAPSRPHDRGNRCPR
jgi:hypothetical protein